MFNRRRAESKNIKVNNKLKEIKLKQAAAANSTDNNKTVSDDEQVKNLIWKNNNNNNNNNNNIKNESTRIKFKTISFDYFNLISSF